MKVEYKDLFANIDSNLIRPAFGPTPFGIEIGKFTITDIEFVIRVVSKTDPDIRGVLTISTPKRQSLVILNYYSYFQIMKNGDLLLWKADNEISFSSINLLKMDVIPNPEEVANELKLSKEGFSFLGNSENWKILSELDPNKSHKLDLPFDWSKYEETLVLANYKKSVNWENISRGIYSFDWKKNKLQIYAQDWYNKGKYDFDYQWIARVYKRKDGAIIGDGIRIGRFQLDWTKKHIWKWISQDRFYYLQ
jgi:hypothetical protein